MFFALIICLAWAVISFLGVSGVFPQKVQEFRALSCPGAVLNVPSIHSLLSREDGEFIDDKGGSGSDDPLDDGNKDKDYVFSEGYSERGKR